MNIQQIILTCLMWAWSSAEAPPFAVKRHYKGDLFEQNQGRDCPLSMCSVPERHAVPVPWKNCQCQCLPLTPTFRQDIGICVDSLDECQLVPFQSPVTSENIPLVSMPVSGKYVHPSAEIVLGRVADHFSDVVCHVLVERYLGPSGWLSLTNLSHTGPTFQLVHNSKKFFLQFVGDEHERSLLDGHLVLVEFSCKTKSNANIVPHPCAAFRVAGKLSVASTNDVLIAVGPLTGRWRDWIIIGLGIGLLGVTYVLAILVYLVVRKRHEKQMLNANSQMQSIRPDKHTREGQNAMMAISTCSDSTSSDCANLDIKFHSRISLSDEEGQSGPSRLLSQLRSAWNAATTKLRGRRLTFSPSLLDIPAASGSFCRSVKSSDTTTETASRCQSPGSDDNSCRSLSTLSSAGNAPHPRGVGRISDPTPLLSSIRRSYRTQTHFAEDSSRAGMAQRLESKTKNPQHWPGRMQSATSHKENLSHGRSAFMDSMPSETWRGNSSKGYYYSLTDSMRRKAVSCENITVLTVVGASEFDRHATGPGIDNRDPKQRWRSDAQRSGWETMAKGNGYRSLRNGQEKAAAYGRGFGTPRGNFLARSESTCSIDCKRKSVSFDLRDTVILGQPAAGNAKEKDPDPREQRNVLDGSEAGLHKSEVPFRKMTSFATLCRQSKSNAFLHLNDCAPQKRVVRVGRSESNAGDYGIGAVQRLLENGDVQPLASILKRSESSGRQGHPMTDADKRRSAVVSRSQSVASSRQKRSQSEPLERIRVKSLVDSFNQKSSRINAVAPSARLENKRIWQVVNEDSGYHSSDSDKSLKRCGNGTSQDL